MRGYLKKQKTAFGNIVESGLKSSKPLVNTRPFAPCRTVRRSFAPDSVPTYPLRQKPPQAACGKTQ